MDLHGSSTADSNHKLLQTLSSPSWANSVAHIGTDDCQRILRIKSLDKALSII